MHTEQSQPDLQPQANPIEEIISPSDQFVIEVQKRFENVALPIVEASELLVAPDYSIVITREDIADMCAPYDEFYKNRIQWTQEQITQWIAAGKPTDQLPAECFVSAHPNRMKALEKGMINIDEQPHMINPLTGELLETDGDGNPLHPLWKEMLLAGAVAGPGFYYREGNVGNVEGLPAAQDPVIFRFVEENGVTHMELLLGVRTDDTQKSYALLGGMVDASDISAVGLSRSALSIAEQLGNVAAREANEEGGIDLLHSPRLPIGTFLSLDSRTTLNTVVTSGVTAFYVDGDSNIDVNKEEMVKVEWVRLNEALLRPEGMYSNHERFVQMALKVIHDTCGLGFNKNGEVVRTQK